MDLLRFQFNQKYLCYDYETTCLNLVIKEIQTPWQLGWLLYKGNKLIQSNEDWLLWPDLVDKMDKWGKTAARLTHWTKEEYLARAVDPLPVYNSFFKYLYSPDYINITANGISFDQYINNIFSKLLDKKHDYSKYLNRSVDIQGVFKATQLGIVLPKINTDDWGILMLKMSNVKMKCSLAYLCKHYNVEYSDKHHISAHEDGTMTFNIFQKQINTHDLGI